MHNIWMFLQQTAAVSMTALFILLLQRLFREKMSPKWQYTIWFVLLVRLLVPAGMDRGTRLDVTGWVDSLRVWGELGLDSAFASPWSPQLPRAAVPLLNFSAAPVSVTDWLFVVYLAGAALCGLWLLVGWRRLARTVKQAVPVEGARLADIRMLAGRESLPLPSRVVETRSARTPFLMGVLSPTLVLPMGWEMDEKVVLHELLHLKNRDVLSGWVTALFRCVHWCNPFLWQVFDRIDNQREERCDQQVLERLEGEQRRDYGRVLLSMAEDDAIRVPGATTMANGARRIKQRIQSIARFKTYPTGIGLVSVCMTLILIPNLAVGFPSLAAQTRQQSQAPLFVSWMGKGGQMAYGMSNRPTTVAGALDAYAKAIYHQWYSPNRYYGYQAMVLPEEELPGLWSDWNDGWGEDVILSEELDNAYRSGPMFRGLYEDGDGGYYTQMYFFREEDIGHGQYSEDVWERLGYRRHTLHLRPREDGTWTVSCLSIGTGTLGQESWSATGVDRLDYMTIPIPERPILTWTGEFDGVRVELWPQANMRVQDAFLNGSNQMLSALDLNEFGQSVHTDRPDPDALFTSVEGSMAGVLTNLTGEEKKFTLSASDTWMEYREERADPLFSGLSQFHSGSYTGYDLTDLEIVLQPGESRVFHYGGRGMGNANAITAESCVVSDTLRASYTLEDGTHKELQLKREVNLE